MLYSRGGARRPPGRPGHGLAGPHIYIYIYIYTHAYYILLLMLLFLLITISISSSSSSIIMDSQALKQTSTECRTKASDTLDYI